LKNYEEDLREYRKVFLGNPLDNRPHLILPTKQSDLDRASSFIADFEALSIDFEGQAKKALASPECLKLRKWLGDVQVVALNDDELNQLRRMGGQLAF
jgi:hypothetical protein